jgi:hypothetical protein
MSDPTGRWEATMHKARERPLQAGRHAAEAADPGASDAVRRAHLAAAMLGAALAALHEYDAAVRGRVHEPVPAPAGDPETDLRRWLGIAIGRLEAAQCILGELPGQPDDRLGVLALEVSHLAFATVAELAAPMAACGDDGRFAGIMAAMTELWAHPLGARDDQVRRSLARAYLAIDAPGSAGAGSGG